VATDFSPSCAKALERAVAVAGQSHAALTILHVIDVNTNTSIGTAADLMKSLWTNGAARLHEVSSSLPQQVKAQTVLEEGLPWEVLVEKSRDFDLLILGQNNTRRRWSVFSQQTAQRVLLNSACPVLVIDGQN
jgi:nucleotide-binding universal stress UspA family protein